jgi:hypothetical protein
VTPNDGVDRRIVSGNDLAVDHPGLAGTIGAPRRGRRAVSIE